MRRRRRCSRSGSSTPTSRSRGPASPRRRTAHDWATGSGTSSVTSSDRGEHREHAERARCEERQPDPPARAAAERGAVVEQVVDDEVENSSRGDERQAGSSERADTGEREQQRDDHQPAVVWPLQPVERHRTDMSPGAEHADDPGEHRELTRDHETEPHRAPPRPAGRTRRQTSTTRSIIETAAAIKNRTSATSARSFRKLLLSGLWIVAAIAKPTSMPASSTAAANSRGTAPRWAWESSSSGTRTLTGISPFWSWAIQAAAVRRAAGTASIIPPAARTAPLRAALLIAALPTAPGTSSSSASPPSRAKSEAPYCGTSAVVISAACATALSARVSWESRW